MTTVLHNYVISLTSFNILHFFYQIRAFTKDLYFHVYSYFTVYSSIKIQNHTMAVPNRGTGSCDQAVSALEAALEVCALPFYVYGVPNSCLKPCT